MFVFSLVIFTIIFVILGLIAILGYLLTKYGYLNNDFYTHPYVGLIIIFCISFILSGFTILVGGKVLLKPIREMIIAMQELSHGNFDIQVNLSWGLHLQELSNFCESFNETAKELRSIEMLRSDFVNNFSHEFKTPIVSLQGFAELLKHEDLPADKRNEYLDIIISESNRLSTLATNVLNLSKIESQAIVAGRSTFNLSEQIRNAILMMESKWLKKELDLQLDLLEIDSTEIYFYGNAELLNQVWVNVLDNAIKYSDQNGKLEIELLDFYDKVTFKLKDYGCGMDTNTQAHIFNKFYRANTSQAIEGNGLGLTIVQKIVDLHRGQISIESKPKQGTSVTVSLPKQLSEKKISSRI